jgi:hypothetical protein
MDDGWMNHPQHLKMSMMIESGPQWGLVVAWATVILPICYFRVDDKKTHCIAGVTCQSVDMAESS